MLVECKHIYTQDPRICTRLLSIARKTLKGSFWLYFCLPTSMMVIFDLLHSSTTISRQPDLSEAEQSHFLPTLPPYRILLAGLRGSWASNHNTEWVYIKSPECVCVRETDTHLWTHRDYALQGDWSHEVALEQNMFQLVATFPPKSAACWDDIISLATLSVVDPVPISDDWGCEDQLCPTLSSHWGLHIQLWLHW